GPLRRGRLCLDGQGAGSRRLRRPHHDPGQESTRDLLRLGRRRRRSRGRSARPDRATLGARSAGLPPQPAIERSYRGRQPHRREAPKNRTWFPQLSELSPPATSQPWCEMANSTHHQDTRPPTPQDRVEPFFPVDYGLGVMRYAPPRWMSPGFRLPAVVVHSGSTATWLFHCPDLAVVIAGTFDVAQPALPFRFVPRILRERSPRSGDGQTFQVLRSGSSTSPYPRARTSD